MATLRKRQGKNGIRWNAIVRKDGQVQSSTFRTKSEAKVWASAVETEIERGNKLPSSEAKRRTVRELLERYKEFEVPKKGDRRNPIRIAGFWINEIGNLRVHHLTPAVIVEIRDKLGKERSGSTVNRYLALLSHACTVAEREWGWLESNPVRKVSRLPESQGRVRYLSEDERGALLKATSDSDHPYLHAAVLIAITTGARKSEILGLGWTDIDLVQKRAVLGLTKNRERRSLTLVPRVVEELKKLKTVRVLGVDSVFIDPSTGKPARSRFEEAWRAARDSERSDHCRDRRGFRP
jgi:integrase